MHAIKRRGKFVTIAGIIAISMLTMGASECDGRSDARVQGEKEQEKIMQKARQQERTYHPSNFLTRQTVNKWMRRMDVPGKVFYVYVMGDNGQVLRYHVASSRPVNICTFLTPPMREYRVSGSGSNPLGPAPALDGVYYGGGGCTSWYFFDAETDAYVELVGGNLYFSDQPLTFETEPIKVTIQKAENSK